MSTPVRQAAARDLGAGRWRIELDLGAARPRAHPDAVSVLAAANDAVPARVESVVCDRHSGRLSVVLALPRPAGAHAATYLRLRGEDGWLADVALGTAPEEPPVPSSSAAPAWQGELDFRARDYEGLRTMLLGVLAERIGDGLQVHPVAEMTALVELLAYLGDALSYSQDAVATEAYLASARQRVSVTRHAALLDYRVSEGRSARVWAQLTVSHPMSLPTGTQLLSRAPDLPARVTPERLPGALSAGTLVFETCAPVELQPRRPLALERNRQPDGRLPAGAIAVVVVVAADEPLPAPGVLATIGPGDDAPPGPGHVVRLCSVHRRRDGVLLRWDEQDALPAEVASLAPLCVRLGNLVLADHGRTHPWAPLELFGLGPAPWPALPHRDPSMVAEHVPSDAWESKSAHGLLRTDGQSRPAVTLRETEQGRSRQWSQRTSLLCSGPLSTHYVVELETDRTARVRFGDGAYGLAPDPQSAFEVRMRTGSGMAGSIAAGRLAHIVSTDARVLAVTNPEASVGAADPEPLSSVRLAAPHAFRYTDRALTIADLVDLAGAVAGVADADAAIDQTGAGPLARVAISSEGSMIEPEELAWRVRQTIAPHQPIGVGLDVRGAILLAVTVEVEIAVLAGWSLATTAAAVDALVQSELLAPSRRRFGVGLYRSQVVTLLAGIPGVLDVTLLRFGWTRSDPSAPHPEALLPPFGTIIQIAQEPAAPQHGSFSFRLRGVA